MTGLLEDILSLLKELKNDFDEEGWYCIITDKNNFNQNPDLHIDFNESFDYKDVRVLSIIDIENRLVMNAYFYIIDDESFYLVGDKAIFEKPLVYYKNKYKFSKLLSDVKKVINYY